MYNKVFIDRLNKLHTMWDESECMIGEMKSNVGSGYHSTITGRVHGTNITAEYASGIFYAGQKEYYKRAVAAFERLGQLQDSDPESKTYGLWPYFKEEDLHAMKAPDYNFSDFISKHFIYVLKMHSDELEPDEREMMKTILCRAMRCSIKRNVSPDYSNISMMSSMTIISAAELLEDEAMLENGKARLCKAYKYNMFSGAFSEYNSSTYTILLLAELTRMKLFFKDEECCQMAQELEDLAWENLSLYYNTKIGQLSPPEKRSYRDLDDGQLSAFIYLATDGKYGSPDGEDKLVMSFLTLPFKCPDRFLKNFDINNKFIDKAYYKKNNIRSADEDTVIIRSLDSPELHAYTFMTDKYSMGAFDKSDLWNQRRTCSVVWSDGNGSKSFRLRGINGDYDYCSALSSVTMTDNSIGGLLGYATDHGDFHYILDKDKSGAIKTNYLGFKFCLSGNTDDVKITRDKNVFTISDSTVTIRLNIIKWIFDGKEGEIACGEKEIELIGYQGAEKEIDIKKLKESYAVFTMTVNGDEVDYTAEKDGDAVRLTRRDNGKSAVINAKPCPFDEFMNLK